MKKKKKEKMYMIGRAVKKFYRQIKEIQAESYIKNL